MVSALQFSEFLKGFGPLSSCATNVSPLVSNSAFHINLPSLSSFQFLDVISQPYVNFLLLLGLLEREEKGEGGGACGECCLNLFSRWFHGYMSFDDAERLLNNEAPGSFLFRLRNTRPGKILSNLRERN